MDHFLLSANAVLPMFVQLAAGFLSQKAGILSREDIPGFNRVAFRIFLPCLLFYNIYKNCITFEIRIFPWKNLIFQTVLLAKSEKK